MKNARAAGHEAVLAAAVFLLGASLARAGGGAGKAVNGVVTLTSDGRSAGMGGAQTAVVDDPMALRWNPAGLGVMNQDEVVLLRDTYLPGVTVNGAYFAQPTKRWGTWGAGVAILRVGDIAAFDATGVAAGSVSASDTLLTLGWGRTWAGLGGLAGGVNVKQLKKELDGDSASATAVDLGLRYAAREGRFRGLRTGWTYQNLGSGVDFFGGESPLPRAMALGFAYPLYGNNMIPAVDFVLPVDGGVRWNAGLEYALRDFLAFRIGYKNKHDADKGAAYGVRLGNARLHVDYAFVPFGDLGDSHRVSVGFRFGKAYRETQVMDHLRRAYEEAERKYGQGYLVEAYMRAALILEVAPWHGPSKKLMGRVEEQFKEVESATKKRELLDQINTHYHQGEQYFLNDDLLRAKKEFDAILALQTEHAGARSYARRIGERFRSIAQTFYEEGARAFAAGDYCGSVAGFEKVLAVNPANAEAREFHARAKTLCEAKGRQEELRAVMAEVKPMFQEGLALFGDKRYEDALEKFTAVLKLDGENLDAKRYATLCRGYVAETLYAQGMAASRDGDWRKAEDLFTRSLKLNPDKADARRQLAVVRPKVAEDNRKESQRLYRDGLDAFLSGDDNKAMEMWKKAVGMDPDNREAQQGINRIQQRRAGAAPEPKAETPETAAPAPAPAP
jgi:tetratricopeptide (TPR) repeat protein